jgi:hypothetical protein
MRWHLLATLVVIAMLAVSLPGVATAANGGYAADAHACAENHSPFANVGECVSFFAQGGTLDFQFICESLDGTYIPRGTALGIPFLILNPGCEWAEITFDDLLAAWYALSPLCPPEYPPTYAEVAPLIAELTPAS